MPTLSNGSELEIWEDTDNQSPDAILFNITETDGDVLGPVGARTDFPFGWVDLASVDVFEGFFTVTTFTNDGRTELFTTLETFVFDNEGNFIRALSAQAAYLSTEVISVTAASPDDITVTWLGANEYYGGQNTQYGEHQIILEGGAIEPDTFVNHAPTVNDMDFQLSPGETLIDVRFSASDIDYDLLTFVVVDGPDHGTLEQETQFDEGYYPFPQGSYGGSLHHHSTYLNGNVFDYTPAAGFIGTDSFTVYATDGQGNSNLATITITIEPPAEEITLTDARNVFSYDASDHPVLLAALGGDDRITGSRFGDLLDGGAGNDRLHGGAGNDEVVGGGGRDHLYGDAGDDVLAGGAGRDVLVGGEGRDTFFFDGALQPENRDRIEDFLSADDVFSLAGSVFGGAAPGALDADAFVEGRRALDEGDRIIYDACSGRLLFDADGSGDGAAVIFAAVNRGTAVAAEDFYFV